MGVTNEYGKLRKLVLSKPDNLRWMPFNDITEALLAEGKTFTQEDAYEQHREFCEAFESNGVEIMYIPPTKEKDLPYQMFTRDFGVATRKGVLLGNFFYPERRGEEVYAEKFFVTQGIPIFGKVTKGFFEGGDITYIDNETLACGLGGRSNKEGIEEARKLVKEGLGLDLIAVEFPAKYIHLDEIYLRLAERACLACVPALPDYFLKILRDKKIEIIEVSLEEQHKVGNNVVAIDDKTIVSFKENESVNRRMEAFGFEVLKPSMSIFIGCAGGPHCATFPLERDGV